MEFHEYSTNQFVVKWLAVMIDPYFQYLEEDKKDVYVRFN